MHCHTTCFGVRVRLNVFDSSLCWTPMETECLGWDVITQVCTVSVSNVTNRTDGLFHIL